MTRHQASSGRCGIHVACAGHANPCLTLTSDDTYPEHCRRTRRKLVRWGDETCEAIQGLLSPANCYGMLSVRLATVHVVVTTRNLRSAGSVRRSGLGLDGMQCRGDAFVKKVLRGERANKIA